jgi:hypothetical protein
LDWDTNSPAIAELLVVNFDPDSSGVSGREVWWDGEPSQTKLDLCWAAYLGSGQHCVCFFFTGSKTMTGHETTPFRGWGGYFSIWSPDFNIVYTVPWEKL